MCAVDLGLRRVALLLACGILLVSGCARGETETNPEQLEGRGVLTSEANGDELVVCISGMVTPEEGLPYYEGLSEYIADSVGRELRLIHKAEYAELNELLAAGDVDMAFSCSGPYVTGHDQYGLELLVAPVANGKKTYQAYIIVPASSTAQSLDDLRGATFAFTDPDSNTGCLVPTYMLAKRNTTPEEFFGRVVYTYSHDNSIRAVATGEADAASVDSLIWEYANATNPVYTASTRVLSASDEYAIPPVVVRPGMSAELKDALLQAFLAADEDPRGRELLAKMHIERFEPIDDAEYDSVRAMCEWIESGR